MADLDYYGADYGAEAPSRLSEAFRGFGWVNWAGAATSLGLTAFVAVWAVDLTFRDMSAVPVIAALEGPMRVEPENPGGMRAPFQGLAMSDITSGGSAAPAPEEVVLAPEPVDLSAPSVAVASLAEREAAAGIDPVAQATAATAAQPTPEAIVAPASIDVAALAAELSADVAPLEEIVGASAPTAQVIPQAEIGVVPQAPQSAAAPAAVYTGPGLARSARPSQRPARAARPAPVAAPVEVAAAPVQAPTDAPAAAPVQQVASAGGTLDVDPASVAAGTRVVQLGAYDSEAAARSEWDRLHGRFRDYMDGKQRMVQKARSGGRDFWRLRVVGFADGSDARRFCSALLAKDAACIPVTVR